MTLYLKEENVWAQGPENGQVCQESAKRQEFEEVEDNREEVGYGNGSVGSSRKGQMEEEDGARTRGEFNLAQERVVRGD